MQNKISNWDDEEVKTLFKYVEIKKADGVPLIKIFDQFAKCVGRCQKSVRNYYYLEIKNLHENKQRCKKLNINIENHHAKKTEVFSSIETKNIVETINKMVNEGHSVRGACLELSGGDATKMVRLQNKYRSEMKNKNGFLVFNKKDRGCFVNHNNQEQCVSNIIKMPVKNNNITDEDIKALFMGMVKLVKKQALEMAKETMSCELVSANQKLKKAMAEIVVKSAQIENLQKQITLLNKQIDLTKQKEIENRIKSIQGSKAGEILRSFVTKRKKEDKILNRIV